jgi:DNA-binding response OmpR family regulator
MARSRILVIDDNLDLTKIISMVLSFEGFLVKVCNTLEEGTACLEQWEPHLLLLDVNINGEDARELSKEIKKDKGDSIKIILMSGDELNFDNNSLYTIDDYIAKPFDTNHLVKKIRSHLVEKV